MDDGWILCTDYDLMNGLDMRQGRDLGRGCRRACVRLALASMELSFQEIAVQRLPFDVYYSR